VLALVQPKLVVALGATAARELLGRTVVLSREAGRLLPFADGRRVIATIHPSAVVRMRDEASRHAAFKRFIGDLKQVRLVAENLAKPIEAKDASDWEARGRL
jgi:uracil-DNA glycosylase